MIILLFKDLIDITEYIYIMSQNLIEIKTVQSSAFRILIEALKGIIQDKKPNIIFMNEVKASITYLNNKKLLIFSKNAIFNNKSFETRFFDGVELRYEDQKLTSDSLDFLFDKNIAIFKDNVRYENLNTKMFSNKITINLLTKEIEINSKNSSEKIRIEKK